MKNQQKRESLEKIQDKMRYKVNFLETIAKNRYIRKRVDWKEIIISMLDKEEQEELCSLYYRLTGYIYPGLEKVYEGLRQ